MCIMDVTNNKGRVMEETKELLELIKLRNYQMKDILETMKNNSFNLNATDRIELEFVINNLHTLNLFIDKDIEKKEGK